MYAFLLWDREVSSGCGTKSNDRITVYETLIAYDSRHNIVTGVSGRAIINSMLREFLAVYCDVGRGVNTLWNGVNLSRRIFSGPV